MSTEKPERLTPLEAAIMKALRTRAMLGRHCHGGMVDLVDTMLCLLRLERRGLVRLDRRGSPFDITAEYWRLTGDGLAALDRRGG